MKKEVSKLDPARCAVMAAILGISNLGMDSTFLGPDRRFTPEDVAEYFKTTTPRFLNVENAVLHFANGFLESDEMAAMFVDEAESWNKTLQKETVEQIKRYRYAEFLEALLAVEPKTTTY